MTLSFTASHSQSNSKRHVVMLNRTNNSFTKNDHPQGVADFYISWQVEQWNIQIIHFWWCQVKTIGKSEILINITIKIRKPIFFIHPKLISRMNPVNHSPLVEYINDRKCSSYAPKQVNEATIWYECGFSLHKKCHDVIFIVHTVIIAYHTNSSA